MSRRSGLRESQRQERRLAELGGGTVNAGSGNHWQRKGDVRWWDALIEHKWTGKKQVTIKSEVLEKIYDEAIAESRYPVLGLHLNGRDYVVLDESSFCELRTAANRE